MRPRRDRAAHRGEVHAVGERRDHDERSVEHAREARRVLDVDVGGNRVGAEPRPQVAVGHDHLDGAAGRAHEIAGDDSPHGARAAEDDDAPLLLSS